MTRQGWARFAVLAFAAVTLLTSCTAAGAAETPQPAESPSGSGASEWLHQVVLNDPPPPASMNPFDVLAGRTP